MLTMILIALVFACAVSLLTLEIVDRQNRRDETDSRAIWASQRRRL